LTRAYFADVLRDATWAHFAPPKRGPDGGRDVEIYIDTPIGGMRTWIECKHHASALGLQTLGKYLVVVIVRNVHHLYIVSSSEVTENARDDFTYAVQRQGVNVHFLDGERFAAALQDRPHVLQHFFPDITASLHRPPRSRPVAAAVRVTEYEESSLGEILDTARLRPRRPLLYVHVMVRNDTAAPLDVTIEPPPASEHTHIARDPASPPLQQSLDPYASASVRFVCTVTKRYGDLQLGPVVIRHGPRGDQLVVPLPAIDLDQLRVTPLTGDSAKKILGEFEYEFAGAIEAGRPAVLHLAGGSGTGKSRLIEEMVIRLRKRGILPIPIDATALRRDDALRHLLVQLMNLPMRRGSLADSGKHLAELLTRRGATTLHIDDVHAFLTGRAELGSVEYAVAETFRNVIRQPVLFPRVTAFLDNIQNLSARGLDLVIDLAEFLSRAGPAFGLVVSENTEVVPHHIVSPLAGVHQRIETLAAAGHVRQRTVDPLEPEEARRLLFSLIRARSDLEPSQAIVAAEAPLLHALVAKVGTRPFDLVMTAEWLRDQEIVAPSGDNDWRSGELRRFQQFVRNVPPQPAQIIKRRLETICDASGTRSWQSMQNVLTALVAFSGTLPLSFLTSAEQRAADTLVSRSMLRYEERGVATLLPFHDNIRIFLEKQPSLSVSTRLAGRVLRWIDRVEREHLDEWSLVRFRNAVRARRPAEQIIRLGEMIVGTEGDSEAGPLEVIDVGQTLVRTMDMAKLPARQLSRYLDVRSRYADALLKAADFAAGVAHYEELQRLVAVHRLSSVHEENRFYHRLVKAQIAAEQYVRATAILDARAAYPPADVAYGFLLEDRRVIVRTAFGDISGAEDAVARAKTIAASIENGIWESIAESEHAYIHLHGTFDRSAAQRFLQAAIDVYETRAVKEDWRDLELIHHEVLIALLKGYPASARGIASGALKQSRETANASYEMTTYDLLAFAAAAEGDGNACRQALIALRAKALITYNPRALRRAYANLAVLDLAQQNHRGARDNLDVAISSILDSPAVADGALQHFVPVIAVDFIQRRLAGLDAPDALRSLWSCPSIARYLEPLRNERPHLYAHALQERPCSVFAFQGLPLAFG
jgi:restriction endonuclease